MTLESIDLKQVRTNGYPHIRTKSIDQGILSTANWDSSFYFPLVISVALQTLWTNNCPFEKNSFSFNSVTHVVKSI